MRRPYHTHLYDKRLQREVVSGGERQQVLYGFQRFFSRMAHLQIRPQQSPILLPGQLLALTEVLPTQCWQEFPDQLQAAARNFPPKVAEI